MRKRTQMINKLDKKFQMDGTDFNLKNKKKKKALLIDFVIQNLNENQCDYVQINQKMLFDASCVDFSNRKCEKISRNCFEQFDKIKYLNLSNNLFENISIFLNSNYLEELVLDYNNIKSISLGPNFRQLKKLNLANNNLKAIKKNTFDSLENLNELDLSDNQLHSIDNEAFVSLENLNYLFLSNNCLDSVEFSLENCGNLYQIYLCSNKIKSIQPCRFQALKKLTVLNLSNNLIEELNDLMFNGLKSLENRIEKVFNFNDLNSCTNLEFLNLSDNLIEKLNNMEHLYLNKNIICKIELDTVDDYSNLKLLDLSENRLNAIQKSRWHDFSKSSVNNFQLII
ncbi:chaoptin isoform X2 [Brachionus plicatilis]|uniref:Chaoptin isoform X2 n=1 Tax=Brachionus plicatilis TaxID=10195 RepID=A0A3M7P594_BRAPC|nr:chaoptin isoform X2 [Brachionus plicatilis]